MLRSRSGLKSLSYHGITYAEKLQREHGAMGTKGGITGENGGPCATRTHDQLVKSQLLYRLS
jgi:hypothetical protein